MGTSERIEGQAWADTTSYRPVLVGRWMLKHGVDTLRMSDEMRQVDGSLTTALGYRYAQVRTDLPGAWTVTANTRTANGSGTTDIGVSATTDQMWVQPALMAKSGGAMAQALCSLQTSTAGDARVVASSTFDIQAYVNSGEAAYIPVGIPFPAMQLSSLMFAVVLFGVDSTTVQFQPIWRAFTYRLNSPGAWSTLDSQQSVTADTAYNSGSEAVSPGTVQYVQAGMKVGGTGARGTIQVLVAGKF